MLIPRTSFLGAILVTGYLGGAVWTHLRVGDPWFFPIIIGIVMWGAETGSHLFTGNWEITSATGLRSE